MYLTWCIFVFQTFHAPSFGEEDFKFEIPAITLPTSTESSSDCSNQSSPTGFSGNSNGSNTVTSSNGTFSPPVNGYNNTHPLSHPSTDFLSEAPQNNNNNSCYTNSCGGITRPPPAYNQQHVPILPQQQLQHPQQTIYHGAIHVQSSYCVYPPQQQQYNGPPGHPQQYYRTPLPPTSHGLHYFNNNNLVAGPGQNIPIGYCGGAQNLPQFSQFIPPSLPMMQQQQREPILASMDKQQQMIATGQQGYSATVSSPSTVTSPSRDSSDSSDDTPLSQVCT